MGIPVLILGKSGAGKSASLRNFPPEQIGVINVMGKPLPFRNPPKSLSTASYPAIKKALQVSKAKSIALDDAGYLITDQFMRGHSETARGNSVFSLYNDLADSFYELLRFTAESIAPDKIV